MQETLCRCPFCGAGYRWITPLISHIGKAHKDRNNKCPACGEEFGKWMELKEHLRRVKDDDHLKIYCLLVSPTKEKGIATLRRKYYHNFLWLKPPIILSKI